MHVINLTFPRRRSNISTAKPKTPRMIRIVSLYESGEAFGAIGVDPSVIDNCDGSGSLAGSLRDLSSFKEYSLATIALGLQYLSISHTK